MTRTLLLRLAGPQQSWGGPATQRHRPTEPVPTYGGVLGLLAAALGAPAGEVPERLRTLELLVRADRPGAIEQDFHTVSAPPADVAEARQRDYRLRHSAGKGRADYVVPLGNGMPWVKNTKVQTFISHRAYIADAEFILAATGPEELIAELAAAVRNPVFTPYLGRLAYAPTFPFTLGARDGDGMSVLKALPTTATGPVKVYRVTEHATFQAARIEAPTTATPLTDWKQP